MDTLGNLTDDREEMAVELELLRAAWSWLQAFFHKPISVRCRRNFLWTLTPCRKL